MSMKNSIDTIGNRTRDLPACSAVPWPAAPPRGRNVCLSVKQTFIQLLSEFIKLIFWMNVSCGLPNVVEFVGTSTSYTGLGFRSHPGYQLFSLHETGIYMAGAVCIVVPTYWTTHSFIWQGQFMLWFPPTGLHTVLYGRGSLCCGSHLLDYTQFYMAGAVYVVVPTYWTTHNFITQITTIKILWPGFLWFLPSPISRCHDSLLYYATSFLICLISAIENIIK